MAPPRERPPEPARITKKLKKDDSSSGNVFYPGLFASSNVARLGDEYKSSGPFKHSVIENLFSESLLDSVKDEILENIHFTEKETDIYRVRGLAVIWNTHSQVI
jgi:prolyl 3-hydroxylase /prolyl 3,4-dihydroxylase